MLSGILSVASFCVRSWKNASLSPVKTRKAFCFPLQPDAPREKGTDSYSPRATPAQQGHLLPRMVTTWHARLTSSQVTSQTKIHSPKELAKRRHNRMCVCEGGECHTNHKSILGNRPCTALGEQCNRLPHPESEKVSVSMTEESPGSLCSPRSATILVLSPHGAEADPISSQRV